MIERTATARVQRLVRWPKAFQRCFGHRAQRLALSTYAYGLSSGSARRLMHAKLARLTEPFSDHAFQHCRRCFWKLGARQVFKRECCRS